MEGTNKKIKALKRQAYCYWDQEFFKLRILEIHEAKYVFLDEPFLLGEITFTS
jgi:hypothetical protein